MREDLMKTPSKIVMTLMCRERSTMFPKGDMILCPPPLRSYREGVIMICEYLGELFPHGLLVSLLHPSEEVRTGAARLDHRQRVLDVLRVLLSECSVEVADFCGEDACKEEF